jgi:hypothetical protein
MGGAGEEGGFGGFSTTLARGQGYGLEFDISIRKIFRSLSPPSVEYFLRFRRGSERPHLLLRGRFQLQGCSDDSLRSSA